MRKQFLDQSSLTVLALAEAVAMLKKSRPDPDKIALTENFQTIARAEARSNQVEDGIIKSDAIRIGGFLLRCLMGQHIGDETDNIEINYGYDADGQYHYFEIYPDFCWDEDQFENLNLPLQAAYLRINGKIENFLRELSVCCDYEEGDIDSESGIIYFNTKIDLYKILARYTDNIGIDINSIENISLNGTELDCFKDRPVSEKQYSNELTGLLNARVEERKARSENYEENLLRYSLQRSFPSLREYKANAYLVEYANTPQTMNVSIYFALMEEAAKLEEGINRNFEGPCLDRRNSSLRPTIN